MVRHSKRAVSKSTANSHDFYIGFVIANIIAHLLQTTQRREICNRVGENNFAAQGHAGGDSSHVLLGHARVQIALWKSFGKGFYDTKTQIPHNKMNTLIVL